MITISKGIYETIISGLDTWGFMVVEKSEYDFDDLDFDNADWLLVEREE